MQNNDEIIQKYTRRLKTIRRMFKQFQNESQSKENKNILRTLHALCRILDMKIISLKYKNPISKQVKKPLFSDNKEAIKKTPFE